LDGKKKKNTQDREKEEVKKPPLHIPLCQGRPLSGERGGKGEKATSGGCKVGGWGDRDPTNNYRKGGKDNKKEKNTHAHGTGDESQKNPQKMTKKN